MSERIQSGSRWFRIFFLTVECFGLILVLTYWILPFTGSIWGTKFRYQYLFDGSAPIMMLMLVCALLTWRRYRKHALVQFAVLLAWVVWAALPRL
jgi:hypothetical protein